MDRLAIIEELAYFPLARLGEKSALMRALAESLTSNGYTEAALRDLLGVGSHHAIPLGWQAILTRYVLSNDDPVHLLVRLFCLNLPVKEADLLRFFGAGELDLLREIRLLGHPEGGLVRAPVALWPFGGLLVASDHFYEADAGAADHPNRVMSPGVDSLSLARMVTGLSGDLALDLGTGTGIVALCCSARCASVTGVDVNPRAVNFACFNALLNGVANCRFLEGHLYEPVSGERFDLIAANPPYVPTPKSGALLFRDGGPGGEEVLSQVVTGCAAHLGPAGACLIATDLVEHQGIDYEQKVRRWLGDEAGLSCAVLAGPGQSPYEYALRHVGFDLADPGDADGLYEWVDRYQAEGIAQIRSGYIVIRKTERADVRVERFPVPGFLDPDTDCPGFVQRLLLQLALPTDRPPQEPVLGPELDLDQAEVLLPESVLGALKVPYPLVRCLESLSRDGVTVEALVAELGESGYSVSDHEREVLKDLLVYLRLAGYLVERR